MPIYLHDIPLSTAIERLNSALAEAGLDKPLQTETIPLDVHALGRVLAAPIWAKISSPHYHASAMDGFAIRAHETNGALQTRPISLNYGPQTEYVDTGDPLPAWANAVIPIEDVEPLGEDGQPSETPRRPALIRVRAAVPPWSHVRPMGEDMVATQLVLPAGHVLRPVDLGAIAGCGHDSVEVAIPPRVAILPTGTELVPIGHPPEEGDIIEYNSLVLAAQVEEWGGEARRYPIIPDEYQAISARVREAAQAHDLILLNAGSSAGSEDYSARVVEELGQLLVHGVAVRPGHPVILGLINAGDRKVPIIGVPGYPVSTALTGEIFVEPLLARWMGRSPRQPVEVDADLTRKITSPAGDDDYLRVTVGQVGERTLAAPLSRGSGVITSLVRADGIVVVPRGSQGYPAGERVKVRLYRPPSEIQKTIFAIGSHDLTLDILAQFLTGHDRRLASANVGSLGGLVSLRRGEAHLAGAHLLDPESGQYNLPYVDQYLPDQPVLVMALVGRTQGLFLPKGNPKDIHGLSDLKREDILYVNRQRGAGTRLLLDYHLGQAGIDPEEVAGYEREEYTHLTAAAAVASGRADCGLGIEAAAHALDLDFIPLFNERYDLIIPKIHAESQLLAPLLTILEDPAFSRTIAQRPGYDVEVMGTVIGEL
ncbi:MAG: Molybdopterin molybdenumtransferase [Chloroflexi bacterium]|nr:Molybdopterin molybdenumtransferase [Chloroflexota bacterium]